MNDFEELTRQIIAVRDARSWALFHTPKNLVMALAAEAGELLDLYRWTTDEESREIDATTRTRLAEKIADVAIFLLTLCHGTGIDLRGAILTKLTVTEKRYPVDQCRGRANKWTEYR